MITLKVGVPLRRNWCIPKYDFYTFTLTNKDREEMFEEVSHRNW